MLFRMLPIQLKNFNNIIKKIRKQIFRKSKIQNKTKTESVYLQNYFLPEFTIKKQKKRELSG